MKQNWLASNAISIGALLVSLAGIVYAAGVQGAQVKTNTEELAARRARVEKIIVLEKQLEKQERDISRLQEKADALNILEGKLNVVEKLLRGMRATSPN